MIYKDCLNLCVQSQTQIKINVVYESEKVCNSQWKLVFRHFMINTAEPPEEILPNNNLLLLFIYLFFLNWYFLQAKMSQMMMKTFALESPLKALSLNVRAVIKTNQRFISLAMPSICCFVTTPALRECN